jgi:hypothetical protein
MWVSVHNSILGFQTEVMNNPEAKSASVIVVLAAMLLFPVLACSVVVVAWKIAESRRQASYQQPIAKFVNNSGAFFK